MTIGHAALDRGLIDGARLSAAFARLLATADEPAVAQPASLLGLEHEFTVHDAAGVRLDFRSLIHGLATDGARLDPGDPNAYRCSWGGVFTADGREAELATPPVARGPGFGSRLIEWAALGRAELERLLPTGVELRGYSTHVSAAMPDHLTARAARLYAEHFAPALMMLLDGPASPGLLVRPRPGRLELGGEFVDGARLGAVAAFVAGSARLCGLAAAGDSRAHGFLPPRIRCRIVPARMRYGWFVGRSAFGFDLYAQGREAHFRRRFIGRIGAQPYLEAAWVAARQYVTDLPPAELDLLERLVDGRARLPIEAAEPASPGVRWSHSPDASAPPAPPPEGQLIGTRRRPGFSVRPAMATWDFAVFAVTARRRVAYASVPRPALGDFLAKLDRGALDGLLRAYLAQPATGRLLASAEDASRPGLHDAHVSPRSLLPAERRPGVPGEAGDRPGKRPEQPPAEAGGLAPLADARLSRAARVRPQSIVVAGAVAACLVLGAVVLVVAGIVPLAPPPSTPFAGGLATPEPTAATETAPPLVSPPPPSPTQAPSPTVAVAVTPEDFTGTWNFVASDPRVLAATGDHAGGTVVLEGSRYVFTAGDYPAGGYHRSEASVEFHGIIELACRATYCTFEGLPMYQLYSIDGRLVIVDPASLSPLGTFGDGCGGWVDIPDGGALSVESTGFVDGQEVVTTLTFAAGTAAGTGEACEFGSHVVAWDVTATRLPAGE